MKSLGFAVGFLAVIMIAIVIMIISLKFSNNDNAVRTKYDERQQIVRGTGYKYSFWTVVILQVVLCMLDAFDVNLPIKNTVLYFLVIAIGVMVHTTYCIFHDGYFGINNNPKQYYLMFVLIGLFNLFIGILNSIQGRLFSDGKLDVPVINFICGLMFVILGICIAINKYILKNEDDSEDDDEDE